MFQKAKTKFGKLIMLLLVVVCTVCLAIGLVGCSGDARSISSVAINDAGHLIITWSDSEEQDLGLVVGADGQDGDDGATGAPGTPGEPGTPGQDGDDGRGIVDVEIDENGDLWITYSDSDTPVNIGKVKGEDGTDGTNGSDGAAGQDGVGIASMRLLQVQEGDNFTEEGLDVVGTYYWEITYTDSTAENPHIDRFALPMISGGTEEECTHENVQEAILEEHTMGADGQPTQQRVLRVCDDCGYAWLVYEDAEHTFDITVVDPTCTTEGYTTKKCTVCGYEEERTDIVPALNHEGGLPEDRDDWTTVLTDGEWFCDDGGYVVAECTLCHETVSMFVEGPLDHQYSAGTTSFDLVDKGEEGLFWTMTYTSICEFCGKPLVVTTEQEVPSLLDTASTISTFANSDDIIGGDINIPEGYQGMYMRYELEIINKQNICTDPAAFVVRIYAGANAESAVLIATHQYDVDGETSHLMITAEDAIDGNAVYVAPYTTGADGAGIINLDNLVRDYGADAVATTRTENAIIIENFEDQASCQKTGTGVFYCELCGVAVPVQTSQRAHDYSGDWGEVQAPTCENTGIEGQYCVYGCGSYNPETTQVIDALGHNYVADPGRQISVKINNYETGDATISYPVICSRNCGELEANYYLTSDATTDIIWSVSDITVATCAQNGSYSYTATYKGVEKRLTVTVQATDMPHFSLAEYLDADGYLDMSDPDVTAALAAFAEEYGEDWTFEEVEEASCAGSGTLGRATWSCPICSTAQADITTVRHHVWEGELDVVPPTCTTNGSISGHCGVCDEDVQQETINMLGHHYDRYELRLVEGADGANDTLTLVATHCAGCDGTFNETIDTIEFDMDSATLADGVYTIVQDEFTYTYSETTASGCAVPGVGTYKVTFSHSYNVFNAETNKVDPRTDSHEASATKQLEVIPHKIPGLNGTPNLDNTADVVLPVFGEESVLDKYDIVNLPDVLPTCQDESYAYFYCADCQNLIRVRVRGSHAFAEGDEGWIVDDEPDCENPGSQHKECIYCHESSTDLGVELEGSVIPATGHGNYSFELSGNPTQNAGATISVYCGNENCPKDGAAITTHEIPALSEASDNLLANGTGYTITETGDLCLTGITYVCTYTFTYDGVSETYGPWSYSLEAAGHVPTGSEIVWTVVENGSTYRYSGYLCSVCGKIDATKELIGVVINDADDLSAFIEGNNYTDGMTIEFGAGTFDLGTFTFSGANGITIKGAGAEQTTLVGNIALGAYEMGSATNATFTISDLTLRAANGVSTGINTQGANGTNNNNTGVTINITNCVIDGFAWGFQMNTNMASSKVVFSNTDFVNVWCAISIGSFDGVENSYEIGEGVTFDAVYQLEVFEYNEGIQLIAHNFYAEIGGSATAAESVTLPTEWPVAEEAAA